MTITQHSIDRFRERTGTKKSNEVITRKLLDMLRNAKEIQLKPVHKVKALLNHNFQPARYLKYNNFTFVVSDTDNTLITLYDGETNRFQ